MNNKKSPLIPSLILVAALLLAIFYLMPLIDEVNNKDLELVTAQEENAQALKKLETLQAEKAEIDVLTPDETLALGTKLPKDLRQDEVIRQIEGILTTNQVTVKSLTFGQPGVYNKDVQKVTTTINLVYNVQGTIPSAAETVGSSSELAKIKTPALSGIKESILNIIKSFEQNPRLFSLKGINLVYGQDNINITIALDFYFQK